MTRRSGVRSTESGTDPGPDEGAREEFAESWHARRLWPRVLVGAVGIVLLGWLAGGGGIPQEIDSNRMTIERSTEPVDAAALPAATGARDVRDDDEGGARVLPLSWGRMPDAPIRAVRNAPGTAFGDGIVVVGQDEDRLALASLDLTDLEEPGSRIGGRGAGEWTVLPDSPLPARADPLLAVVDESTLLVWGGVEQDEDQALPRSDGAVLDVATGTWTPTPPLPLQGVGARDAVWTGTELVVVGSGPGDRPMAMRWEPGGQVWERLEDPPVRSMQTVQAVASNDHVVALGVLHGRGLTRSEVFFVGLDLDTLRWREYRLFPPRRPDLVAAVPIAGRLLVWGQPGVFSPDEEPDGLLLEPVSGQWRQVRPAPLMTRAGRPTVAAHPTPLSAVWTGQVFIVAGDVDRAPLVFEPESQAWVALVQLSGAPWDGQLLWAEGRLLRWGGRVAGELTNQLWILPAVVGGSG